MTTKTIQELDEMREERGINKTTLSVCCGASHDAWGQSVRDKMMSLRFKRNAIRVFKFYDKNGYVPTPSEIELEPLGRVPAPK
jgi:hypothetical protein